MAVLFTFMITAIQPSHFAMRYLGEGFLGHRILVTQTLKVVYVLCLESVVKIIHGNQSVFSEHFMGLNRGRQRIAFA